MNTQTESALERTLHALWDTTNAEQAGIDCALMQLVDLQEYRDSDPDSAGYESVGVLARMWSEVWTILHDSDHLVDGPRMGAFSYAWWTTVLDEIELRLDDPEALGPDTPYLDQEGTYRP